MEELRLSNFVSMLPDYLLTNDERTLFDWLVFKCSYNFDWYRHSIPQVQAETGVKRKMQDAIIKKFKELGFLRVQKTYYQNNPYRSFFVDFPVLSREDVLERIIKRDSATFPVMLSQFKELAKEQKTQTKRSRAKQKNDADEECEKQETFQKLLRNIDDTWKDRIDMYNNGELTTDSPERVRVKTQLNKSKMSKEKLKLLRRDYDDSSILKAFIAYADGVLTGDVKTSQILPYFLTYDKGEFPVFGRFLEVYSSSYSRTR